MRPQSASHSLTADTAVHGLELRSLVEFNNYETTNQFKILKPHMRCQASSGHTKPHQHHGGHQAMVVSDRGQAVVGRSQRQKLMPSTRNRQNHRNDYSRQCTYGCIDLNRGSRKLTRSYQQPATDNGRGNIETNYERRNGTGPASVRRRNVIHEMCNGQANIRYHSQLPG